MAKLVFRHPNDPPKKELAKKVDRKRRLMYIGYVIQTMLTLFYIAKTIWILKQN